MNHNSVHIFEDVVRFENVDAAAMVYHPVYLTFIERARSQRLIDSGHGFKQLLECGLGLVIASADMKFIRPLRLEDRFFVASQVNDFNKSIINMTQAITTNVHDCQRTDLKSELRQMQSLHFFAQIKIAVIARDTMRPTAMPEWMLELLTRSWSPRGLSAGSSAAGTSLDPADKPRDDNG